jgi:molybdopterin converting factor small subunit
MQVRFFATLRPITGCAEADIPYQETAGALACSLCVIYGEKLKEKIFPSGNTQGEFGPEIIFLINGRHVSHLGGPAAVLNPEDRVDVFPVVAGG